MAGFTAHKSIEIAASEDAVWKALTTPELIKQYMFGAEAVSDWTVGSTLVYRGEWEGENYEDHGTILEIDPPQLLKATYFSPISGKPDVPENYSVVTYTVDADGADRATLTVSQTNNPTAEAATQSESNWSMVLDGIKALLET